MLHHLIQIWFGWVTAWGYPGIILLMAMESSILPVPSEVVIPPAAYLAAQGKLSWWGVVAAGTFGSWLGAAATYWVARSAGRAFIARWGRWVFVSPEKLARAELFLARYATGGVFFSRLLPVVRHLIGIPCGLIRMDFLRFSVMTVLGSGLWCSVLAWYGEQVGRDHPQAIDNPELFIAAVKGDMHLILLAIVVLAGLYLLALWLTRPKPAPLTSATTSSEVQG